MSKGPVILWLVFEFGQLYLTPATSETVVTAFLGQSVTLPCKYSSWSPGRNSMCWGKGQCPSSKCNEELLHTDGTKVLWRQSVKYRLPGNIQSGDVSLTISNTNEGDSSLYCCRIEVPGWFNDVKSNIRLLLKRAPSTTRPTTTTSPTTTTRPTTTRPTTTTPPTTTSPTTTTHPTTTTRPTTIPSLTTTTEMMTTAAVFPTRVITTPDLTTGTTLQTRTTHVLTTTTNQCPRTTLNHLPEAAEDLLTTKTPTEGPVLTTVSKMAILVHNEVESEQMKMSYNSDLLMIIAPCVGFVVFLLLLGFLLRGKVTKTNCLQKNTRQENVGGNKNVLNDVLLGTEDEDGVFTL
ncbi:T-cell immunoglobulin and mucin domain-containing protein 4 isoform X1 [Elephas maximus indicus]|uniref:T-cell immunoglobulin and mucin domain-containing protein 4 isoform X1 n=1 Tax=Elephas maximus indicus TaxID=99487 RepID=UPI002116CDC3|nr:T-cell immunoglobulin and mucin domain-containing protein 4 isoform X1 [Elephas maximus indicus]